ncbi:HET-domain-containing protein [Ophiobolus disseminans]|uniref:HET-domain-containing protein n=1 Tax=Ophiobolus disseminans TaxID=1469910 RepID=A0A6A6ZEP8_9PLEO|nr:HET-domain-containing protein [Ophiobolus disseminans]
MRVASRSMSSPLCTHKDVHEYDSLRSCLSCGETWYQSRTTQFCTPTAKQAADSSLSHNYSGLHLGSEQQIRLAILLPGKPQDPIHCTIVTVPLNNAPAYEALSYTWATEDGDDSKSGRVHCQDGVIPITENCEAALRCLKLPVDPRILWVDSICINQSSILERNHQVGLMDQIYRLATKVQICIQDPGRDYSACIRRLRGEGSSGEAITQTAELLSRRYFTRVWVIQEVVLAKAVVLRVNNASAVLEGCLFGSLAQTCERHNIHLPPWLHPNSGLQGTNSFIECLAMSMQASASDERDKIFAIANLLEPRIRDMVPVDYSLDYDCVIDNAIMACIVECRDLRILSFARLPKHADCPTACAFGMEDFKLFLRGNRSFVQLLENIRQRRWFIPLFENQCQQSIIQKVVSSTMLQQRDIHPWIPYVFLNGLLGALGEAQHAYYPRSEAQSLIRRVLCQGPEGQILPRFEVRAHLLDIVSEAVPNGSPRALGTNALFADDLEDFTQFCAWSDLHHLTSPHGYSLPRGVDYENILFDHQNYDGFIRGFEDYCHDVRRRRNLEPEANLKDLVQYVTMFRTHCSLGFSDSDFIAGDHIYAIDGVHQPLLLRAVDESSFRIVGTCYLWAAQELDYWRSGMHKRRWPKLPSDFKQQTRIIQIY